MIDPEDFKPLGNELRKIKKANPDEPVLNLIADRMIRCMRNWSKVYDIRHRRTRRIVIGRCLMNDLAWVTAFQWTH